MLGRWQKVVDSVLRPARPGLERCLAERVTHRTAQKRRSDENARALRDCVQRIERDRAAIFAANDGVVPASMTELEREWRALARRDHDRGLMDLWARIAPAAWIDHKLWRDSDPDVQVDAAIALAADVEGVEAATAAIGSLRALLAPWGATFGPRVSFRLEPQDSEHTIALFTEPLVAARSSGDVVARALRFAEQVGSAVFARVPDRVHLGGDIAHAAFVDALWNNAELGHPSPVTPLCELWSTGYVIAALDAEGVTLEIPTLQ